MRPIVCLLLLFLLTTSIAAADEMQCSIDLVEQCRPCCQDDFPSGFNCSLPGLETFTPGKYEGVTVNYLSYVTEISSPNFPVRAKEFEACTGGKIVFSDAANVFEDPVQDLGTTTSRGSEVFDGYLMSYSHFPEVSALDLAEHLNDRIRKDNERLKWEDVLPKVRAMGEYRKDGVTNLDFLMYDGDFFVSLVRLDLLEKYDLPLPNTWEEVVTYAKFFNGTDLNDDGDPNDFGFCHFPRVGAGFFDWWFPEAVYSTWATFDQTKGMDEGFFFDEKLMEPRLGEGFRRSVGIWKDLWENGGDACNSNFIEGRCAIGFAPPGCFKGVFLSSDGVSRKDSEGNVTWRPTMKSGEYAEPYRFKPFGSTLVQDKLTGQMKDCTRDLCPKAEMIPARGHLGDSDRARVLKPSPLTGQLINRAPFYWSGGFGCLIRQSSSELKKDLLWDFFVYTNSPETSIHDVANYASWLDSWRFSQLRTGKNFLEAGWSSDAYEEHASVMQWALSNDANGALNLRIPGLAKYTRDAVGQAFERYIEGSISIDEVVVYVRNEWNQITRQRGKLRQLGIYRASLGLDALDEVQLCSLHRDLMDQQDPSVCRRFDAISSSIILPAVLVPSLLFLVGCILFFLVEKRRIKANTLWKIKLADLDFGESAEIIGRGTFGMVMLAKYRGTQVAVKRVLRPKTTLPRSKSARSLHLAKIFDDSHHFDVESSQSFGNLSNEKNIGSASQVSTGSTNFGDNTGTSRRSWTGRLSRKNQDDASHLEAEFVKEMRLIGNLRHPCITTVMGAVVEKDVAPMLVMEYMENGSLYDLLHNESMPIEGELILPILRDIVGGVRFLHAHTPSIVHGDLKADGRFRAKVADFGLATKRTRNVSGTPFWMAPELLRGDSRNTAASDVYSFGVILYEVFSRRDPYDGEETSEVLKQVVDPIARKRPPVPEACPPPLATMMSDCYNADATLRPTGEELYIRLERLESEQMDSVDSAKSFRQRTGRTEELLFKLFPRHIAEALRDGRQVEPEKRDNATVFFSDIVGFTTLSSTMSAEKVTDMLDRLYVRFDELADKYEIFKVDTIGDAYMCCANLVKDQDDHAERIASFSIEAVKAAKETLLDPKDESKGNVNIRAGFHSGPIVARVVGTRTPKYSIFGDTVNTASRMESNSLPGLVQCSNVSAALLEDTDIPISRRGTIEIKGKGEMETFFVGHDAPMPQRRTKHRLVQREVHRPETAV